MDRYFNSKLHGLRGPINLNRRLVGIQALFTSNILKNATVLDLGCAEGLIGMELLARGARLVHGFDVSADRISRGKAVADNNIILSTADLENWEDVGGSFILDKYDIVLFCGVYHHLPKHSRKHILENALTRCSEYLAFRANQRVWLDDKVDDIIANSGFGRISRFVWKRNQMDS
jgi:2-polyprenyl-3-methyl-5-hydroxy-6-metoxy-1,4-benzoquinol methylase